MSFRLAALLFLATAGMASTAWAEEPLAEGKTEKVDRPFPAPSASANPPLFVEDRFRKADFNFSQSAFRRHHRSFER